MKTHFGDRLVGAILEKGAPVCVGLDPLIERLPEPIIKAHDLDRPAAGAPSRGLQPARVFARAEARGSVAGVDPEAAAQALFGFGREVIRIVAPHVPVMKINIAFFERYQAVGVRAYFRLVREAQKEGLIVIGDVKRADIGHSSTQYALGHLGPEACGGDAATAVPDAVTVNPYFGFDAIRPFVEVASKVGGGLFVLVQTSNESADQVQGLALPDGSKLCEGVARLVQSWSAGDGLVGSEGYSSIGAVVSPRDLESTERIRALMPSCIFLVPGFGAQGRTAREIAMCFKPDGTGAIVNASRSVIYAHHSEQYRELFGDDWARCIEQGCEDLVAAVRSVVPTLPPGSCR